MSWMPARGGHGATAHLTLPAKVLEEWGLQGGGEADVWVDVERRVFLVQPVRAGRMRRRQAARLAAGKRKARARGRAKGDADGKAAG